MSRWSLVYDDFFPEQEGLREALCTLGNGYFCTRGAQVFARADDVHYPGTYAAGLYNRLTSHISGKAIENEDLVNLPNWLPLTFRLEGGEWFELLRVDILAYRQELDIEHGMLLRQIHFQDKAGRRTRFTERRLVHMSSAHLAAIEMTITPENWSGRLEIRSALDGTVRNAGVERYQELESQHLEPLAASRFGRELISLEVRTLQSRVRIAQAARTRLKKNGEWIEAEPEAIDEEGYIALEFVQDVSPGSTLTVDKVVTLFTSRDTAIAECGLEARNQAADAACFDELLASHTLAWSHLWRRFDVEFEDIHPEEGEHTEMILHLHLFHLLQTTSTHTMDIDMGVPSRGWHGEAYRGHVLWDELFIFPLLNLRLPAITRSLLMYRYRRIDEARRMAREAGYRGAMYPWQSGSNGREESQRIHLNPASGRWIADNSNLQRHVNAAIAYNIWQYYQVTGDREFLSFYGAEMLLEIARFWASKVSYLPEPDRYEIRQVMGPDEFHDAYPDADEPGLNNNAYTNVMVAWVMCRACEILDTLLPEDRVKELCETLHLEREEIELWRDISRRMRIAYHGDGIISQFEGYGKLLEFDWDGYRKKYGNIQRLDRILEAEGDSVNRYKVSKQADVLMLFFLFSAEELTELFERLGYPFPRETIPNNIRYYVQRTSYGSTLSWITHAWVLARLDRARSWKLFKDALQVDIGDVQGGTTAEGIHLGAMAGTVDLMKRGYTGIESRGDVLWLNPRLPDELQRLRMQIRYRGHTLELDIDSGRLRVSALKTSELPIRIGFRGELHALQPNETKEFHIKTGGS